MSEFEEKIGQPIPISRRISEIIDTTYGLSYRGLALRIKNNSGKVITKDTLMRIAQGGRVCFPSELKLICKAMQITEERLKQTDTMKLITEVSRSIERKDDLPRAKELCEYYVSIAVGVTEKCDALNYLAQVNADLGNYEEAHKLWHNAYELARKIADKYGTAQRLYEIILKLMMSYTHRKEFSNLAEILSTVDGIFQNDPEKMGKIYHSKAMIAEHFGNVNEIRDNLNYSLSAFQQAGNINYIGRSQVNLGYFEYKNKNYPKAKELFENAIENLAGDNLILCIAIKEYAKTLIKLDELEKAVHLIEQKYHLVEEKPELKGKFDLLLALGKNDISYAEKTALTAKVGKTVRALACRVLINHYNKLSDSTALMKYYRMEEKLLESSTILDREDF